MNTRIHYMYRDASNYKEGEEVIISGELSPEGLGSIIKALYDKEYFIPPQVGMEDLQPRMISFPSEDDHVWHTLNESCFHKTDEEPTTNHEIEDTDDLVKRFTSVTWDTEAAMKDLGIK